MILRGAKIAVNHAEWTSLDLDIQTGAIRFATSKNEGCEVRLDGFLVLPGLINAHDHLEFNLFPRLGRGPYPNAMEWALDIYHPEESPIREQLKIPKPHRLLWGGIKNLLSGVTSVLHHNPYDAAVFDRNFPVRVIKRFGWAHSLEFAANLVGDWDRTPDDAPFLVHAAEGTDRQSADEVHRLDAAGVLGPFTTLVHGVGLDATGLALLKQRGASLIWCPSSNCFTLGRTLSREALDSGIPMALGTDSALTGSGDLIDEMQLANRHVDATRLYGLVTLVAARILRLNCGEGAITEGSIADLVVVRDHGQTPAEALLEFKPELVIVGGQMKLISRALADRMQSRVPQGFEPIGLCERGRWLIDCPVKQLLECAQHELGQTFRLAGKRVAA